VTTQRHLTRTVVLATASAVFAVAATGSALAWTGVGTVATGVRAPSATPSAAPAADPAPVRTATAASPVTASPSATPTRTAAPAAAAPAKAAAKPSAPAGTRSTSTRSTTPKSTSTAAKPATVSASSAATASSSLRINRYVDAPGSQKAIDKCNLVLWTHKPMWLAAHNYCGYQWLAYVETGRTVVVTHGAAAGTYVVTGHRRLTRQSGSMPSLHADLVLQTCVGKGTGLTLLRRVA
jgi:hypothetical protein